MLKPIGSSRIIHPRIEIYYTGFWSCLNLNLDMLSLPQAHKIMFFNLSTRHLWTISGLQSKQLDDIGVYIVETIMSKRSQKETATEQEQRF